MARVHRIVGVEPGEELPAYAWPGGYPIVYLSGDCAVFCPACANGANGSEASTDAYTPGDWRIVDAYLHMEGPPDYCEHCGTAIESAYGEVEDAD